MMGNLVATTGPDARKFVTPPAGSRKNSWLVKSTRAAIVHASLVVIAAKAGPSSNARPMRQMRAISRILWLLDRPPARAMTHTGTLGGGAAVVGRSQAGNVELHNLKHRLGHQAQVRSTLRRASGAAGIMLPRTQ